MSAPKIELVRTDDGWHVRIVGRNGLKIVASEVLTRKAAAGNAARVVASLFSVNGVALLHDGYVSIALDTVEFGERLAVPLREVDERTGVGR